uniref:Uncharacterized protein n=1 Tax=Caenorhabditis japonica TaxID=281687 RepID=A0A8R1EWT8_CAEJA
GYHTIYPFFATTKCDLILSNPVFKWVHIGHLFLMTAPMMLGVGFTIERVVAITMAQSYEHVRTFLGPMLVFVLVGK